MKLDIYSSLPEKEQWNVLWLNAKFLRTYETEFSRFVVYSVFDFFIEVELSLNTNNVIVGKKEFSNTSDIEEHVNTLNRKLQPWEAC